MRGLTTGRKETGAPGDGPGRGRYNLFETLREKTTSPDQVLIDLSPTSGDGWAMSARQWAGIQAGGNRSVRRSVASFYLRVRCLTGCGVDQAVPFRHVVTSFLPTHSRSRLGEPAAARGASACHLPVQRSQPRKGAGRAAVMVIPNKSPRTFRDTTRGPNIESAGRRPLTCPIPPRAPLPGRTPPLFPRPTMGDPASLKSAMGKHGATTDVVRLVTGSVTASTKSTATGWALVPPPRSLAGGQPPGPSAPSATASV